MADYGIVMVFDKSTKIEGPITLKGYEKAIPVLAVSFGSSGLKAGYTAKDTRVSVTANDLSLTLVFGHWVGLIQAALYKVENLKQIVITQLAQSIDAKTTAAPTVVQKVTLTNPIVTSLQDSWADQGERLTTLTFNYEKILFEIDKKKADFTNKNFTAGAV